MQRFIIEIDLSGQEITDIKRSLICDAKQTYGIDLTLDNITDDDVKDWLTGSLEFAVETRNDWRDLDTEPLPNALSTINKE